MHRSLRSCVAWVGVLSCIARVSGAAELFVSPTGNDASVGTRSEPLATLEAARDRLRSAPPAEGKAIRLLPGDYLRAASLDLGPKDEGLTISSADPSPAGRAKIVSGVTVPASSLKVVTDADVLARCDPAVRGKLVELDLRALNIRHAGPYPDLFVGNGGMLDLYVDGGRMPLSRWPDGDAYVTMAEVKDSGLAPKPHGGTFVYRGARPERWASALEHGGVWLVGFWRVPWTCQAVRVKSIDAAAKTITLAAPVPSGIGSKYSKEVNGTRVGDGKEPWYATNLLEEIHRPGQWSVDFSSRHLYWLPDRDLATARIVLSDDTAPVIAIRDTARVTLEDFDTCGGLGDSVVVERSESVSVLGLHVLSAGSEGIHVVSGTGINVRSCDVCETGGSGIDVSGGDRKRLLPSRDEVANNHVHHTGRTDRSTYAIHIDGVGVRVANNLVHDAPLGGILYGGNDNVMELNEVHNIGLEGGDLGAFYCNGDWAARGNVIRHNLVHHAANCNGVYFDDGRSGDSALSNIFSGIRCGVFIGGGHDNVARGNVVVGCPVGLHLDDRGRFRNYTRGSKGALTRVLDTLDLGSEPWASRYPDLLKMLSATDRLPFPTGNALTGNLLIGASKPVDLSGDAAQARRDNAIEGNLEARGDGRQEFIAPDRLDFRAAPGARWVTSLEGFSKMPLGEIGLRKDDHRAALPTDEETGRFVARKLRQVFDSEVDVERSNAQGPSRKP